MICLKASAVKAHNLPQVSVQTFQRCVKEFKVGKWKGRRGGWCSWSILTIRVGAQTDEWLWTGRMRDPVYVRKGRDRKKSRWQSKRKRQKYVSNGAVERSKVKLIWNFDLWSEKEEETKWQQEKFESLLLYLLALLLPLHFFKFQS